MVVANCLPPLAVTRHGTLHAVLFGRGAEAHCWASAQDHHLRIVADAQSCPTLGITAAGQERRVQNRDDRCRGHGLLLLHAPLLARTSKQLQAQRVRLRKHHVRQRPTHESVAASSCLRESLLVQNGHNDGIPLASGSQARDLVHRDEGAHLHQSSPFLRPHSPPRNLQAREGLGGHCPTSVSTCRLRYRPRCLPPRAQPG
mmetsp:Transcript_79295/g.227482  ORF Transcript_79295/g.227482 Transcript_79295/m.227482 type:complete len:201 (-) Transcript_79295:358-960(-)